MKNSDTLDTNSSQISMKGPSVRNTTPEISIFLIFVYVFVHVFCDVITQSQSLTVVRHALEGARHATKLLSLN